jgi:CRISPR-associated protein Cas1
LVIPLSIPAQEWLTMKTPQYINGRDIYVGKVGEALRLAKEGEKPKIVPLANTSYVVIVGRVQVSTQALWLLSKKGIHVHYYLYRGDYIGSFLPRAYCSDKIRTAQYEAYLDEKKRQHIAYQILEAQRHTRITILREYSYRYNGLQERIKQLKQKIPTNAHGQQLFGYEGSLSSIFYKGLSQVCKISVTKRAYNPAKDEWNCLLSWSHALLYNELLFYLWQSGLDPFRGFLHEMQGEQYALAYDLSELFKPLIERWVVTLCNTKKIKDYHFSKKKDGTCLLNTPGKTIFDREWESLMRSVRQDNLSLRASFQHEIVLLKKFFGGESYAPGNYA